MKKGRFASRRAFPRLNKKNIVSYEQCEGLLLGDLQGMAMTKNIGLGGILVQIDHSFPIVGSFIRLEIGVKDHIIKAKGKIVHVKDLGNNRFDTGIQFVEISDEDSEKLKTYCEEIGTLPVEPEE